jgi:hypothetical protein
MRGLNLTQNTRMRSNGYFSMIGDDLINPSTNSDLQETYFNKRVSDYKSSPTLKAKVKEYLKDSSSGVYFNPSWNKRLAFDELGEVIAKSAFNTQGTGIAWQKLKQAKEDRSAAISRLKKDKRLNKDVTNENLVNDAISSGKLLKTSGVSGINDTQINELILSAIKNIEEWVIYQTIGDAYYKEIQRRDAIQKEVDKELLKGDLKKLKALRSTIKFEDLIDKIDEEIKTIEQAQKDAANRTEDERKAKALADAEAKALADAIKKAEAELAAAKTDEEKAAAQAKLKGLKNSGSNGAGTGLPKIAIYGGIALVVAIGAYFMFRKKD